MGLAPLGPSYKWICRACPVVLGSFHRAQRPPGSSVLSGVRTPFRLMQVLLPAPSLADTEAVTPPPQDGPLPLGEVGESQVQAEGAVWTL